MSPNRTFPDKTKVNRALISVYDKSGLLELAAGLQRLGVEIFSSGGTFKALSEGGIPAQPLSKITGAGEWIGGRVKTLHPKVHAGILALRGVHDEELDREEILPFDMVVVNLYPFETVVASPDATATKALDNIDIGGPAMVRAAAKNFPHVAVVTDPEDYHDLLDELERHQGEISAATRLALARKAFEGTSRYDRTVAGYLNRVSEDSGALATPPPPDTSELEQSIPCTLEKVLTLRYGENPHQRAAFYRNIGEPSCPLADAEQLHGKELSFNNLLDLEAARLLVSEFSEPAAAILKHSNPCGAAIAGEVRDAYLSALATDPVSAFGGIVAFNRPVSEDVARELRKIFIEAIIAPEFEPGSLDILKKKKNLRLIMCRSSASGSDLEPRKDFRCVQGGFLVQDADTAAMTRPPEWRVATDRQPTDEEDIALRFGWSVVKHIKSNAILFAGPDRTLAVGAGQMSRVDSVRLARMKAQVPLEGSVLASDAFFPFRDGIDQAAEAGATAVVQPGGSVRDQEVIDAANELGLAMILTGQRHFRH